MARRPLILLTPSTQRSGAEMLDHALSVGSRYFDALVEAGGLPLCLPLTTDRKLLAEAVARADGVMFTGGDDIEPRLYWPDVPKRLVRTCLCAEPARDVMELELVREVIAQRKPVLAICRGHQLVNVALGGSLFVDLATQRPGGFRHSQMDRKFQVVHDVKVAADSQLAAWCQSESFGVNSTHHQAIDRVADPLRVVAVGPDGVVEATELRPADRGMLPWFASIQFHPERLSDRLPEHARLFRAFVGACRPEAGGRGA